MNTDDSKLNLMVRSHQTLEVHNNTSTRRTFQANKQLTTQLLSDTDLLG